MPKKTESLLPLDFSVLRDFVFTDGPGESYDKTVCIMTAAFLVTEIARGKTTLEKAIMSDFDWEYFQIRNPEEPRYHPQDKVLCVSRVLRDFCISRNDCGGQTESERKEWAMKLLPRIVDTAFGIQTERRAQLAARAVEVEWTERREAELERLRATAKSDWEADDLSNRIDRLQNKDDLMDVDKLALLDAKIEAILPIFDRARAGRDKRRATLAQKKQA